MAYTRFFMPLESEATGYDFKGRTPAGRCIVESRDGLGKLTVWAQDIRPETRYGVYLIFPEGGRYAGVLMGNLNADSKGKAEMRRDIESTMLFGFSIEDMTCVAVIAMDARGKHSVVSPLCGYRERAVSWRGNFFEKKISDVKIEVVQKDKKEVKEAVVAAVEVVHPVSAAVPEPPTTPEPAVSSEPPQQVEVEHPDEPLNVESPQTCESEEIAEPTLNLIQGQAHNDETLEPYVATSAVAPVIESADSATEDITAEPVAIVVAESPEVATAAPSTPSEPSVGHVAIESESSSEHIVEAVQPCETEDIAEPALNLIQGQAHDDMSPELSAEPPTINAAAVAPSVTAPVDIPAEVPVFASSAVPVAALSVEPLPLVEVAPLAPAAPPEPVSELASDRKPAPRARVPSSASKANPSATPETTSEVATKIPPEAEPPPPPTKPAPRARKPKGAKPTSRKAMTHELNEALNELHNATLANSPARTENILAIEAIFLSKKPFKPFKNQSRDICWVQLTISDAVPLPHNRPLLLEEPFVRAAYTNHDHLILGITPEGKEYVIGVPCEYNPDELAQAKRLGFTKFKTTTSEPPKRGNEGYWLMFVNM